MKFKNSKRNVVFVDSKAQRSSEQTNTHSFCPRNCYSNLKQSNSKINTRIKVCSSPSGDEDAGGPDGAGGAGGVCMMTTVIPYSSP